MVPVCWEQFKYGLWVSGETVALYREYDAAIEALSYLLGQGFDLAVWNIETQEIMYTANWGDGENK